MSQPNSSWCRESLWGSLELLRVFIFRRSIGGWCVSDVVSSDSLGRLRLLETEAPLIPAPPPPFFLLQEYVLLGQQRMAEMHFTAKPRIPPPNFGLYQQAHARLFNCMGILACRTTLKGPAFRPTTQTN
ncbi:hypothetical protein M0657_005901 [Pyricularia oryzae]|nr:hypothetical protein M9X92_005225 [Pyricularia oryzae]KAI7921843.1 hypothetical protein M0657_005901 [Pyricularia oryzae]QBZ61602.1 hypothetical protein PoMZ_08555 [Pyricularia oryzae]